MLGMILVLVLFGTHGDVGVMFREDESILDSWALDVR